MRRRSSGREGRSNRGSFAVHLTRAARRRYRTTEGWRYMDKFFKFEERGTNLRTEIIAGLATFMTMAYIVFVNPGILAQAGVPFAGAATATALGAALMCVCMGFIAN